MSSLSGPSHNIHVYSFTSTTFTPLYVLISPTTSSSYVLNLQLIKVPEWWLLLTLLLLIVNHLLPCRSPPQIICALLLGLDLWVQELLHQTIKTVAWLHQTQTKNFLWVFCPFLLKEHHINGVIIAIPNSLGNVSRQIFELHQELVVHFLE